MPIEKKLFTKLTTKKKSTNKPEKPLELLNEFSKFTGNKIILKFIFKSKETRIAETISKNRKTGGEPA